jgi:hypothetical protein
MPRGCEEEKVQVCVYGKIDAKGQKLNLGNLKDLRKK